MSKFYKMNGSKYAINHDFLCRGKRINLITMLIPRSYIRPMGIVTRRG